MKRSLLTIAKLCAAALLLWLLFRYRMLSADILADLLSRPLALAGGTLAVAATLPLVSLRWRVLLACLDVHVRWRDVLWFSWFGLFMNNFLPASLGSDVSRAVCLFRSHPDAKMAGTMSLVADRVMALLGVIVTACVFGLVLFSRLERQTALQQVVLAVCVGLGLVGCLVLYFLLRPEGQSLSRWCRERFGHAGMGSRLCTVLDILRVYRASPGRLLLALVLSLANQAVMIAAVYLLARVMGFHALDPVTLSLSVPLTLLANMLPVSPGGLGVGEAAFAKINDWLVPGADLLACGTVFLAFRLCILLCSVPGVLQLVRKHTGQRLKETP